MARTCSHLKLGWREVRTGPWEREALDLMYEQCGFSLGQLIGSLDSAYEEACTQADEARKQVVVI